jgi:hypothetical protein
MQDNFCRMCVLHTNHNNLGWVECAYKRSTSALNIRHMKTIQLNKFR